MSWLFTGTEMRSILEYLPVRSNIHPIEQLAALRALRARMCEHIAPQAMDLLEQTIVELKGKLKKEGLL